MITEDISYIELIIRQELLPAKVNGKKYYGYDADYYQKNKEEIKSNRRDYYSKNKERDRRTSADWYARNKDKVFENSTKWRKSNPGAACAIKARRRAAKKRAIPLWFEQKEVDELYKAARFERENGNNVHVDHIVPLVSDVVCGLHCIDNLRIIPAKENISKGNKLVDIDEY